MVSSRGGGSDDAVASFSSGTSAVRAVRVYELGPEERGLRWLVDRRWPRGVSRDSLRLTCWAREVAPSETLRRWFGHDPDRWVEFQRRYVAELDAHSDQWRPLRDAARRGDLLLLYGARDRLRNNAVVLRDYLLQQLLDAAGAEQGGESVCWLDRVCPTCGRLTKDSLDGEECRACSSSQSELDGGSG